MTNEPVFAALSSRHIHGWVGMDKPSAVSAVASCITTTPMQAPFNRPMARRILLCICTMLNKLCILLNWLYEVPSSWCTFAHESTSQLVLTLCESCCWNRISLNPIGAFFQWSWCLLCVICLNSLKSNAANVQHVQTQKLFNPN